jgi:hypothetical protein
LQEHQAYGGWSDGMLQARTSWFTWIIDIW